MAYRAGVFGCGAVAGGVVCITPSLVPEPHLLVFVLFFYTPAGSTMFRLVSCFCEWMDLWVMSVLKRDPMFKGTLGFILLVCAGILIRSVLSFQTSPFS